MNAEIRAIHSADLGLDFSTQRKADVMRCWSSSLSHGTRRRWSRSRERSPLYLNWSSALLSGVQMRDVSSKQIRGAAQTVDVSKIVGDLPAAIPKLGPNGVRLLSHGKISIERNVFTKDHAMNLVIPTHYPRSGRTKATELNALRPSLVIT